MMDSMLQKKKTAAKRTIAAPGIGRLRQYRDAAIGAAPKQRSKKLSSLAELERQLEAGKSTDLANAEANAMRLIGRKRI